MLLQHRNARAQFGYDIIEMTDCIFEAINSNMQVYISALTGRQCLSISHDKARDGLRRHVADAAPWSQCPFPGTCYFPPNICSSLPRVEKAPAIDGPGQVGRADRSRIRPLPPCCSRRAECLLVALPTSWDSLLCAKHLLVEAIRRPRASFGAMRRIVGGLPLQWMNA